MHDMPTTVREEVSMEECASLLSNVPFFQHVDHPFLCQLSTVTSTFLFAPGDIILYSGDMGREMYFIARGYVEVYNNFLYRKYIDFIFISCQFLCYVIGTV